MNEVVLYLLVISFIATLIRSTFGFGESLIGVPLFMLFLPVEVAVPLSVLMSVFIALVIVVQDHRSIHYESAKWLIIFALPGIPLGIALLVYGSESLVKILLGTLILLYALYALFARGKIKLKDPGKSYLFICGFLSGVFGGAYGLNGPPIVVYGNMRQWNAKHFRATLQGYFLPASFLGVLGYFFKGLLTPTLWYYFLISIPAMIPAILLGRYLNHRLKDNSFFRYVYMGLLCIGAFMIINAFTA